VRESLAAERLDIGALDLLARAVLARARTTTLGTTAAPCGHLRALWHGSGGFESKPRACRIIDGSILPLDFKRTKL
jgi:hypothetical protein